MSKEALKLALESLERFGRGEGSGLPLTVLVHDLREALAQQEPNYKKALEVWLDKTEWVQETVKPHELGMHRADVLKQRIKEVLAQPKQDSYYGYKGKCNRVMSDGNPCGLNAPCPDCGLSLIDCPQPEPWEKFCDSNCVWTDHHPDCKLAQRKPLTDELLRKTHHEDQFGLFCDYDEFEQIARAIEASHGIGGEA
jgi:hypothetical protein